jgi:GNAT superfamily N-acetyltransferase
MHYIKEMDEIKTAYPEVFETTGRIQMSQNGRPVGYVNLIREGRVVTLCDIKIYNHSRSIFRFFPWIKIGKNYRGLGHGSALLVKTIEFCKKHEVEEIKGEAMGDLAVLVPWYKKHGFTVDKNNNAIHIKLDP